MIEFAKGMEDLAPRIAVVGVGGAGGNAVASMMRAGMRGVEFVAANTDAQALRHSPADRVVQLGRRTTAGLSAGACAVTGRAAAEESAAEIEQALRGADLCFLAAGLGGGTGTGAAPVVARLARKMGILTVGVATMPFAFEGARRAQIAAAGLPSFEEQVDTLILVPNQNLFRIAGPDTTFRRAFDLADEVLREGVGSIVDLLASPGLVNLDFADLRTVMQDRGRAMMGTGQAAGAGRALRAAEAAISNPLLDAPIAGADGLLVAITGGEDMTLIEVDEAVGRIEALVDPDADIIWGSALDPGLDGALRVSILATGLSPRTAAVPLLPALEAGERQEPRALLAG